MRLWRYIYLTRRYSSIMTALATSEGGLLFPRYIYEYLYFMYFLYKYGYYVLQVHQRYDIPNWFYFTIVYILPSFLMRPARRN